MGFRSPTGPTVLPGGFVNVELEPPRCKPRCGLFSSLVDRLGHGPQEIGIPLGFQNISRHHHGRVQKGAFRDRLRRAQAASDDHLDAALFHDTA